MSSGLMGWRSVAATAAVVALTGCASTADIDTSKAEPKCAAACSQSYSECLGRFSMTPIMQQHTCTDAMRLCVRGCPPR